MWAFWVVVSFTPGALAPLEELSEKNKKIWLCRRRFFAINSNSLRMRSEAPCVIWEINDVGKFQSGQMGQTVNLLVYTFGGSNPPFPTT